MIDRIKEIVHNALLKAGRHNEDVTIVAVSKKKSVEDILSVYNNGHRDFGENYISEWRKKQVALPDDIRWHIIGPLQRNKVKYIIDTCYMLHTLDRIELADEISKRAEKADTKIKALVQVNIASEPTKSGISLDKLFPFLEKLKSYDRIDVVGLMCMPPLVEDPEKNAQYFRKMKRLLDEINKNSIYRKELTELSMGTSQDFEIAIREGATIVRIGTLIFGKRY